MEFHVIGPDKCGKTTFIEQMSNKKYSSFTPFIERHDMYISALAEVTYLILPDYEVLQLRGSSTTLEEYAIWREFYIMNKDSIKLVEVF